MAHIADASTTGPSAVGDWKRQELLAAYVGLAWGDYEKTYQRLLEGGSGLGLSLAQTFVQQHRGIIECDSVPGHTVFKIVIPLQ